MQFLFLHSHSTYFGRKRPSSGVFKTGTAVNGTCVIVAGKSSHHLIRAGTVGCLRPKHVEWLCRNKTCTVLHQVGFYLTYTMMHGNTKLKNTCLLLTSVSTCFEHHYAHLQENKGPVTAFGVLFWFCWMWLVAVVGRCLAGCDHELNPNCHLLALLGDHHILHVSRIRVK